MLEIAATITMSFDTDMYDADFITDILFIFSLHLVNEYFFAPHDVKISNVFICTIYTIYAPFIYQIHLKKEIKKLR